MNNRKTLSLADMKIIHTRLTSFILDKMSKFYKPVLRKMFAEIFSKKDIRDINNNIHKYNALLYKDRYYADDMLSIHYNYISGTHYYIALKKDIIKDLMPKKVALNINYIAINEATVSHKNLRKYYDALNMIFYSVSQHWLDEFNITGWRNPSISELQNRPVSYLKNHNMLMYSILTNTHCTSINTMDIYKYYYKYFSRCMYKYESFLRYLKAFDEYIIKMILDLRSGEWYEKDNKK